MKKFVKPLVIAASVAAVAGIGAVSFAAWSATPNKEVANNSLGHENIVGLNQTISTVDDLVPYDQTATYADNVKTVELKVEGATGAYNVKVEVSGWSAALESGSVLYVKITNSATAPTIDDSNPITDWDDTASAVTTTDNFEKSVDKVYAHFALKSDEPKDMDKTFTVTYTLVPVTSGS